MPNWLDEQMRHEQVRDMLRAAERRRFVRLSRAARPSIWSRIVAYLLARVGRWLELLGRYMQLRSCALADVARPLGNGRGGGS